MTVDVEDLLRELAPQVLGMVARRYDDFDSAEDALQEAMAQAALRWPAEGVPPKPRARVGRDAFGGPAERCLRHGLLQGIFCAVEVVVPAGDHAEDLRRQLAQQVLDIDGHLSSGPSRSRGRLPSPR